MAPKTRPTITRSEWARKGGRARSKLLARQVSRAYERELYERNLQIGADNSVVQDGDMLCVVHPMRRAGRMIDCDYFHGCRGGRAVGQERSDARGDFHACDVINSVRGRVAAAFRKLQRIWRNRWHQQLRVVWLDQALDAAHTSRAQSDSSENWLKADRAVRSLQRIWRRREQNRRAALRRDAAGCWHPPGQAESPEEQYTEERAENREQSSAASGSAWTDILTHKFKCESCGRSWEASGPTVSRCTYCRTEVTAEGAGPAPAGAQRRAAPYLAHFVTEEDGMLRGKPLTRDEFDAGEVMSEAVHPRMLMRACADCGRITTSFCDRNEMEGGLPCLGSERVPRETWAPGQRTPFCVECEERWVRCRFCRGCSGCTPPAWLAKSPEPSGDSRRCGGPDGARRPEEVLSGDQAFHGTTSTNHLEKTRAYCRRHGRWDPFRSEHEFDLLMGLPMDHTAWTAFELRERTALNAGRGEQALSADEKPASQLPSATKDRSAPTAAASMKPEFDKEQREREECGQQQTTEGASAGREEAGTEHPQASHAERLKSAKNVAESKAGSERAGTLRHGS